MTRSLPKTLLLLQVLLFFLSTLNAYRLGDAVDTILRTESSAEDVLRSQMPLFGQTSTALFTMSSLTSPYFSLSFEEGLRPLPWFKLENSKGEMLERLEVTFVHSRSGDGAIFSVSGNAYYGEISDALLVQYNWIEEGDVDVKSASAVMLLLVLLASVLMLLSSCNLSIDDENYRRETSFSDQPVTSSGYEQPIGVPKWD